MLTAVRTDSVVHTAGRRQFQDQPSLELGRDEAYLFGVHVDKRAICLGELSVNTANQKLPDAKLSTTVWLAGVVARTLFLGTLILITARVASPQLEHISSLYETPSDLVRVALGVVVCAWLAINLFILPKDSGGYRQWAQLGVVLVPLAVLCAVVVW
jgi:hypothetical protein